MSRWYSPRGARRGLLLAVVTIMLWITWAVLYTRGLPDTAPAAMPPAPTLTSQDATCCARHLST